MASGDKIRVALETDLETVSDNVTTVTNVLGDSDSGIVNDVETLQTQSEDYETRISSLEDEVVSFIEVTNILTSSTTMASITTTGYYIWTTLASDYATYLTSMTSDDIVYYDGSDWSVYLTYAEAPATVYNLDDTTTYEKSDSTWIEGGSGSGAADVQITTFYDSDTTMASVTTEGYYIWTELASDYSTYLSDYSIGDIAYYDGSDWEIYLTYAESPAAIYNLSDTSSYEKYEGAWTIINQFSIETNQLSRLAAYYDSSTSYSVSTLFHWTTYDTNANDGTDPITYSSSAYTFTLPAGYLYFIETQPFARQAFYDYATFYIYDNTSGSAIGTNGGYWGASSGDSVQVTPRTAKCQLDLRSSSTDHVIDVRMLIESDSPYQVYVYSNGDSKGYIFINQLTLSTGYYLPSEELGIDNTATATENQVLVSDGDSGATFVDPADANILSFDDSPQTVDADTLLTSGVFSLTSSSTNLPDNLDSDTDYLNIQVYGYDGTANGSQILTSADWDDANNVASLYTRSWDDDGSNFTDWYQAPLFDASTTPSSGDILVANGNGGNFDLVPKLRFCKIARSSTISISSTWNYTVSVGGSYINTDTDYFSYDGDQINVLKAGYYRVTGNLSYSSLAGFMLYRISSSSTGSNSNVLIGQDINKTDSGDSQGNISCSGIFKLSAGVSLYVNIYAKDACTLEYQTTKGDTSLSVEWLADA